MEKKKSAKKVTIVIATYNNEETIEDCLFSVFQSKLLGVKKEIIVLDNNSQDGTLEILQKKHIAKNIFLVKNTFNQGFGRTINQAFSLYPKSDFHFILNPDATIKPDSIQLLLDKAFSDKSVGLLSCKIVDPKTKKVLFQNGAIDFLKLKTTHNEATLKNNAYLTGCAILVRKELLSRIGGFDPKFFLYYEDADLSRRALKAGFKISTLSNSICYHKESHSSTTQIKDYFLVRNALYFFRKHYPKIALPYFWSLFFTRYFYHKYISKKTNIAHAMLDFWHA